MKIALLALVLSSPGLRSYAQADSTLARYNERYPEEKLYFHFDRPAYNRGETIWFKAYLLSGFAPSTLSRNLYVDWYDAAGRLLRHDVAPIYEASARGQFDIPAGYAGAALRVRAYTQWMLNFDTAFLYDKVIPVAAAIAATERRSIAGAPVLTFFPEGGHLVRGLASKVAFKACDVHGFPVAISGVVQGSDGSLVDSLTPEHDGMGAFFIQPQAGLTYTATWTDGSGRTWKTPIPGASKDGVTLQVQPRPGHSTVIVRRTTPGAFNLVVHMNHTPVYEAQLRLGDKTEAALQVPTGGLPTGVLQFTLFDAEWRPLAERVTFVNNGRHRFDATVDVVSRSINKRGRNELDITVPDSIFTNLSVSVTDGRLPAGDEDIVARLLLCGDLRGAIYHPSYYFTPEGAKHLDLVMLTHGWRRFDWTSPFPALRYPRDTNMLTIHGRITGSLRNLTAGEQVMLVLQGQRILLPVGADGRFAQKDVLFYDTVKAFYKFTGGGKFSADLSTDLLPAPPTTAPAGSVTTDTTHLAFFAAAEAAARAAANARELAPITINGARKRPVDVMDEQYATGPFKRDAGYQFDVKDDPLAQHSVDIFFYLKQVVPGLEVQYKDTYPILRWRQTTPTLYVDEVAQRADYVQDIPVGDIAYVKVFHPPFMIGPIANARAGAIAIYTRKGKDVEPEPVKGLPFGLLQGYAAERQFYSPDYSVEPTDQAAFLPDVRPTLYWNPYVFTDAASHSVRLTFYNDDIAGPLRVVVEGMNAQGKLVHIDKTIP